MSKINNNLVKLLLSALFIALGLVLPFFTGQIKQIGNMLLPMHLPIMLCGLVCGWQFGFAVGAITPLLRCVLFGMPMLYPSAIAMSFELAVYGLVVGLLFAMFKRKTLLSLYISMVSAMIVGRAVWGIVTAVLVVSKTGAYSFYAFFTGAFINAVPGIILQLILVPAIMLLLGKSRLIPFPEKIENK